jgi:flagellar assembly protein FliH
MLSKILRGPSGPPVKRLDWPCPGGAAHVREAPAATAPAAPPPAAAALAVQRRAELEEQMEARARAARQAGYAEGQAAGRAQAAAEHQPMLEKLAAGIREIAGLRPCLLREAHADLVELSLAIARRILHRQLSVDPGALDGIVGAALEKLAAQEIRRIRVHPEMEPGIRRALEHAGRGGLALTADGTLAPGALLVETNRGKLDASLETQLSEIGRGLADRIPEA